MKTEEQIRTRLNLLNGLLFDEDLQEELVVGMKQRGKIKIKIQVLRWVLDEEFSYKKEIKN